jgi:hypothetical protein
MRYLFSPVFVIYLAVTGLKAQPTLQRNNLATTGYSSKIMVGPATNPGNAGTNITWDFSGIPIGEAGTFSITQPSSTPAAASFPSASYAAQETFTLLSSTGYFYYNLNESTLEQTGSALDNIPDEIYTNPRTYLKFPLAFNDSFSDTWNEENETPATQTVVYDAYGTLITPAGTFNNVVRLKYTTDNALTYVWFTTSPLVKIAEYDEVGTEDDFTIYVPAVAALAEEENHESPVLFPDPASETITVRNEENISAAYAISLSGTRYNLMVAGSTINIETLRPGVYSLFITSAGGNQKVSRFVKI